MPPNILIPILALAASLLLGAAPGNAQAVEPSLTPSHLVAQRTDGSPVSLAEGRGRTALVVFWSPESLASRKSLPELQRFADSPEGKSIFVLAVSTLRDPATVRAFMAIRELNLPGGVRDDDDFGPLDERQLPLIYVFDAEGRLLRQHAGLFNLKTLRRLIDSATP